MPISSSSVMFASAKPRFGRQLAPTALHGVFQAAALQSELEGMGLFAALVKVVTIVSPVGATVAVGCMVTCGEMIRSALNGPSGFVPVARAVAVR